MISIIVCSRNASRADELRQNIMRTAGIKYELIIIDNSGNRYDIFEAYNIGIAQSTGELLCFLHDDIIIHSANWGITITRIFNQIPNIGLLGIAGSKIKTQMPSAWWHCPKELEAVNILQHMPNGEVQKWERGFKKANLEEVAVIDGVFMVMRKSSGFSFNPQLKGFHCYDLDISIACKRGGWSVWVTNEVLIEHLSLGTINQPWYKSTLKLHRIYRKTLPLWSSDFSDKSVLKKAEFNNGKKIALELVDFGYFTSAFAIWLKLIYSMPFSSFHIKFVKRVVKSAVA